MIAVVDCNNFYASCEQVFNPKLENKPVVILSNNDGCIIARSNEAKEAGIKMGAPAFQFKDIFRNFQVAVFSANFPLYADFSHRVMTTLATFVPKIEFYSIDEAFLDFEQVYTRHSWEELSDDSRIANANRFWTSQNDSGNKSNRNFTNYAQEIRQTVKQWTGIPVSIGIASTKTLAKAANEIAKKYPQYQGVLDITDESKVDYFLHNIDVSDVWGIGRSFSNFLYNQGIYTALQLKNCEDKWVKKHLTISGLKTVWELRGIPCISLEQVHQAKKSIISSKSFGKPVESLIEMKEAVASYTARAAEKLREEKIIANRITVWVTTNFHNKHNKQYVNHFTFQLPEPTSDTSILIRFGIQGLERIYRQGYRYKKALVLLTDLVPENERQMNLFSQDCHSGRPKIDSGRVHCRSLARMTSFWGALATPESREIETDSGLVNELQDNIIDKKDHLMKIIDRLNSHWGSDTIKFAAQGINPRWKGNSEKRSLRYTTRWDELLQVS